MPDLRIFPEADKQPFDAVRRLAERGVYGTMEELVESGIVIHLSEGLEAGVLSAGMKSGDPAVLLVFPLPDGRVVLAETSLRLFLTAADAFKAKHGDPRMADLSMPDITLPPDFPPRALIRAGITSVQLARDSVSATGNAWKSLRRALKELQRADREQEIEEATKDG